MQGLFHQVVGLAEEIAFRKTWVCPGVCRLELGLNSKECMPRPVLDFMGVETGHRRAREAGVLTAEVVRTA